MVISTLADGAFAAYPADLDGDGDMDVLSASWFDDKIAWYENTNGQGSFGSQIIISDSADGASSIFAADIDGDGDLDVLSASWYDDMIAWYENTDGNGQFGEEKIITTQANLANAVHAEDLDGDGDIDVLSASGIDDKIAWYENLDGNGNFSGQQIISSTANNAWSVYADDIDGDGDMDVLAASRDDDQIAWFENTDGQGSFSIKHIVALTANAAVSVYSTDIDGDGDPDVVSASMNDNKIAWYENTDGLGNFGSENIISQSIGGAAFVYACDLDNDNDADVLASATDGNRFYWFINTDGLGNFSNGIIIDIDNYNAMTIIAADLSGDSLPDVLTSSFGDNKIAWYKNLGYTNIDAFNQNEYSIFPNPCTDQITIEQEIQGQAHITITDVFGVVVFEKVITELQETINISTLESGVYFIDVFQGTEKQVKKIVKI